jgi:hypothetical protein
MAIMHRSYEVLRKNQIGVLAGSVYKDLVEEDPAFFAFVGVPER